MPIVRFTSHLRDVAPDEPIEVEGSTTGEALRAAFVGRDRLRSYVFDDAGRLRRHVAVFVDGELTTDRVGLGQPLHADSEVYVMQALSGG
ncbi:MAG: MoaD/ThiS family protein [Lacipirellulaceae bacterium]